MSVMSTSLGAARARQRKDFVLGVLLRAAALITALIALGLSLSIVVGALPNVTLEMLTTAPSYVEERIGLLPDMLNTIWLIVTALALVIPMGVGTAVWLTEYAPSGKLSAAVEYAVETLAGIPSIIFGLVGMLIFCQWMGLQTSLLAGALTLMVMNLPTVIRTTQESLRAVDPALREAALGLGAMKWHMIRTIVLPSAARGMVTGAVLSVGRMLGESAALLFTAGFAHTVHGYWEGMRSAGASLSVSLYVYAKEQGEFEVAFVIALLLLLLSVLVNLVAAYFGRSLRRN